MLDRAVEIDGVIYRHHEVIQIRHTNQSETFARVHSTAGDAAVNTEHQLEYNIRLSFQKAEEAIAELPFFAEVEDPYAEIVEEQAQLIDEVSGMLTDDQASDIPQIFPEWAVDTAYKVDDRRRHGTKLYKCLQDHTSQADWTPDVAASLWVEIAKPGEIPVWRQPTGAQDAYNIGDKVHYPDADSPVYESLIDANVYSPEAYPAGWQEVSNDD